MFGFKLIDQHVIEDIKSEAFIYEHEKSGAQLLHIKNDDDNKVFSVAFRTPPKDSTGVPHIVEHCVLSGSRKYKTKEPFMDMVKGSLKTFINAMTFSDKTIYPVASRNEKDFRNLMDVYLDAVYFPMIHEDKTIFMQEGWHHNIFDKEDPIKYNGVVYNEMRGAYSQPTTLLGELIGASLFPDTTYQYSSGGNPDHITDLTFEDFKKFHKDLYHPSNSYIYVYGNGDIEAYMAHMDKDYLCHFDKKTVDSAIALQKPFSERVISNGYYGIAADETTENKTYLSMNYVLGDAKEPINHLIGDILKDVLVNAAAGPVKKALLDAGIGQDIMASTSGGLQLTLSIIAKNADIGQKEAFESIVEETLKQLIKDGIDKDLLESAINTTEYDLREATGFATKGIIYHIQSMSTWLYDGEPTQLLSYNKVLSDLRNHMTTDYFERFIEAQLIENKHASLVTLSPEKGLGEAKAKADEERLAKFKATLSDTAIETLIKENEVLKEKQLSPDSKEALATMPKLSVDDVNKETEALPIEVIKKGPYEVIKHPIFTNGIGYVEYLFNTEHMSEEELPYLALLTDLLGKLDTTSYGYGDLNNTIYKLTGGINLSVRVYSDPKHDGMFYPKFVVGGKAVIDKLSDLSKLMNVLLVETKFDDFKRIKELLLQNKSRLEMAINQRGDNYASTRLASYFLPAAHYNEKVKGFEYYWFLSDLVKDFDEKGEVFVSKLKEVYKKAFNVNGLMISFTGDESDYEAFAQTHEKAIENLNAQVVEKCVYDFDLTVKNEGIASSSNVQYCAQGFNFKRMGKSFVGHMQVLKSILSADYLHDRIRAKGGAYGCGISFNDNGNVIATSFRDPNLVETLDVFKEMADYVESLNLDKDEMTKYIIGAISRLDAALTAKGKGMYATANYVAGIDKKMIQKERDEVLATTLEDIKALAGLIREVMDKDYHVVYGNDVKIKSSEVFDKVIPFNK